MDSESNKYGIRKVILPEYVGVENLDENALKIVIDFSAYLLFGNFDEALKVPIYLFNIMVTVR